MMHRLFLRVPQLAARTSRPLVRPIMMCQQPSLINTQMLILANQQRAFAKKGKGKDKKEKDDQK